MEGGSQMENLIPGVAQKQKKQKGKSFVKTAQNTQVKPQAAVAAAPQAQAQQAQAAKPQAV